MKALLGKTGGIIVFLVIMAGSSSRAVAQDEGAVFQISNDANANVVKPELGSEPVEDNKTYMAFDPDNTLYYFDFRDKATYGYLIREKDGHLEKIDLLSVIKALLPSALVPNDTLDHAFGNLQIDDLGHIYLIYYAFDPFGAGKPHWKGRVPILIYSLDKGATFTAMKIPGDPDQAWLEGRTHVTQSKWPPLVGWAKSTRDPVSSMSNRNIYGVVLPRIDGSAISLDQNVTITENSPGVSVHTGGITFACTREDVSYVAYNEIPEDKKGNNIWVAAINRITGKVEEKSFVTNLPKPAFQDIHITPLVVISQSGTLHLITDGDGGPLLHFSAEAVRRSLEWRQVASIPGADIYTSLDIDGTGHLNLVYTDWSHAPKACYRRFDPDSQQWSDPVTLLVPPPEFSSRTKDNYGIYYYKTCLDNRDNFYVSFSFWVTYQDHLYPRQVLVRSSGTGTWSVLPE